MPRTRLPGTLSLPCILCLLLTSRALALAPSAAENFYLEHRDRFAPAPIGLDFRETLRNYSATENLETQRRLSRELEVLVRSAPADALSTRLLTFELSLRESRLGQLEAAGKPHIAETTQRLSDLDDGRFWYGWLLKRWTGTLLSPEEVMRMGEKRIAIINAALREAIVKLGAATYASATLDNREALQFLFEERKSRISGSLDELFPAHYATEFTIAPGDNPQLAQTPGFYNRATETFHYNHFDAPYPLTNIDWLLIHEANPGHHFQLTIEGELGLSELRRALSYPGYSEGWAAYVEQYGEAVGLYRSPLDRVGMLRWNIVRAVRMVLDVGLNYYDWSEDEALRYWKKHITDQDDIAMREIKRMQRWPAQVQTYTVGAMLLEEKRDALRREMGDEFDLKAFHTAVLELGPIPMEILAELPLLNATNQ